MYKLFTVVSLALLALGLTTSAEDKKAPETKKKAADPKSDKIDAAKLVGKWKVTETEADEAKDATFEFTKDKITIALGALELKGSYKVDGDKMTVVIDDGRNKETAITITKLTDDTLNITGPDGKTATLKKQK